MKLRGLSTDIEALVYPNPIVAGQIDLNLHIMANTEEQGSIQLLDALGRIVFTRQVVLQQGINAYILDSPLTEGIYYCVLYRDSGVKELARVLVKHL